MNTFSLLKSIMTDLEKYDSEQGTGTAEDFYAWAGRKKQAQDKDDVKLEFERSIGRLVVNMYRYSRHYIRKKLVQDAGINFEEFVFLANLDSKKSVTKSELIQICIQEKTTGMAVISRLIAMKLIDSIKDTADKRKTVIELSKKGKSTIKGYFSEMEDVVSIIGGRLSDHEKKQLLKLLQKLDDFHYYIFVNNHDMSIEDLMKEYFSRLK